MTHAPRIRPFLRLFGSVAAGLFLSGGARADDAARAIPPLLVQPIDATWSGVPLREVAARLSKLTGLPVVVDRRLDPEARVTLSASGEPLRETLATVAAAAGADLALLASHARLTPAGGAARLRAADRLRAGEIRQLAAADKARAAARRGWSWPDGATPRDLVAAATAEAGIALEGFDSLPHDHLPAAALPPLSLAERLDLVLADFDRRVEWKLRRGAADRPPTFAIVPLKDGPLENPPLATAHLDAAPRSPPVGTKEAAARKQAAPAATYSLKVAARLDELLATLAKRFDLTLELDTGSLQSRGITAGEIIRLSVEDASREKLLAAILEPLGLQWTIEGKTLRVSAP